MPDQAAGLDLAEQIKHTLAHYTPAVRIDGDEGDPLHPEHVTYCLDRIREIAGETTGDIEAPGVFEFIDGDGGECVAGLGDADPATLRAGLAHLSAQAAALHRALIHVTDQGIAILRLLDDEQ